MVELIVTAINVFILFFLIGYLVSDMLSGMLTKRQERIADDINTARMSKEEALALKNDMSIDWLILKVKGLIFLRIHAGKLHRWKREFCWMDSRRLTE